MRTRNGIALAALAVCLLVPLLPARAQILPAFGNDRKGTAGFQFLKIPVDARAAAMGETVVANAFDASALFWNPALAAQGASPFRPGRSGGHEQQGRDRQVACRFSDPPFRYAWHKQRPGIALVPAYRVGKRGDEADENRQDERGNHIVLGELEPVRRRPGQDAPQPACCDAMHAHEGTAQVILSAAL